jgi:RNA polymerase sigma factor (sigma-70 family)
MTNGRLGTFLRHLRRVAAPKAAGGLSDAQLLERWLTQHDQAAFEVLVWRYDPLVLGVCRRLLRDADAEDAFQATFLALVRKAGSIGRRERVGSWLYKVAYRVALRAAKSVRPAAPLPEVPVASGEADVLWRDLRPVLDEEVHRLPEKYRAAFVLCHLQGLTNAEAARELGCPLGTVLSRLAWARERLRQRLTRRGVTLSVGLLAVLMPATVPALLKAELVQETVRAAGAMAAGRAAAGVLSAKVVALTEGVLRAMLLTKLKTAAALLLAVGVFGTGALLLNQGAGPQPASAAPTPDENKNLAEVPSLREGVILVIGTEIKEGEDVPADRVVTVEVGGVMKKYRRLRVGDTIGERQLLGQVDDLLARHELEIKKSKASAAKADEQSSIKAREEAQQRYETLVKLYRGATPGSLAYEEVRQAKFQADHYYFEAISKGGAIKTADLEVKHAQTILETYEIRSRIRGVIRKIYKHPGEAVHALEPVFQIELPPDDPLPPPQKKRDEGGRPEAKDDLQSQLDQLRLLEAAGDAALKDAVLKSARNAEWVRRLRYERTSLELVKADLLEKIISRTQPHKREPLLRQLVECLSTAAQNSDPEAREAAERLRDLAQQTEKVLPSNPLSAFIAYRALNADHAGRLGGSGADFAKVQEAWRAQLAEFVKNYPDADDTPDALLQLGLVSELLGKEDEARKWYRQLADNFSAVQQGAKAAGALRRLDLVGKPLELTARVAGKDSTVDMARLRGKVVIVYYWASWCSQCVEDFDKLKKLVTDYGGDNVTVLGINLDDKTASSQEALRKLSPPGVHLFQPGGFDSLPAVQYGVMVLPTLFLVGKDGKVVSRSVQMNNLEDEVKKLLK